MTNQTNRKSRIKCDNSGVSKAYKATKQRRKIERGRKRLGEKPCVSRSLQGLLWSVEVSGWVLGLMSASKVPSDSFFSLSFPTPSSCSSLPSLPTPLCCFLSKSSNFFDKPDRRCYGCRIRMPLLYLGVRWRIPPPKEEG